VSTLARKLKDGFWLLTIFGIAISILSAFIITSLIEYGREHGSGAVSAIFTPGRQSTENILGPLASAFGLFSSMTAGMSFFILGKCLDRTELSKRLKRVGIIVLLAFSLFVLGFFGSLYFIIFSNSTATATSLDVIYHLIQLFVVGVGFVVLALVFIARISIVRAGA
jgi:ABC-type antimicrobial peptide transport system permease subunit